MVPDTEGEEADFSAGPVYGYNTLDSLRAALSSPATGLTGDAKIGLAGYSGGAIATEWAAQQAPTYAPEINSQHRRCGDGRRAGRPRAQPEIRRRQQQLGLDHPDGARRPFPRLPPRPGAVPHATTARNCSNPTRTSRSRTRYRRPASSGPKWSSPNTRRPESIPVFVKTANKLIVTRGGTPTVPFLIGQGNGGEEFEGTPGNKPGIGPGDGVMIAGDVRSLAREWCSRGVSREVHRIPAPRAHRGGRAVVARNGGVAHRTIRGPRGAPELLGNRAGQLACADEKSAEIAGPGRGRAPGSRADSAGDAQPGHVLSRAQQVRVYVAPPLGPAPPRPPGRRFFVLPGRRTVAAS